MRRMRVSCPNCQTEYDVPDAALAGRQRKLRCAQCGTQFVAGPLAEPDGFGDAAPVTPPPPAPEFATLTVPPPQFVAPPATPLFEPPLVADDWPRPAAAPDDRPAAAASSDNVRTLTDLPTSKPYTPPQLRPVEMDPQDARQIAERESFAALLESSRLASAQEPEETIPARTRRLFGPWQISIIVLLLIIGLIFIERSLIMQLWPPSIRLFDALGLAK